MLPPTSSRTTKFMYIEINIKEKTNRVYLYKIKDAIVGDGIGATRDNIAIENNKWHEKTSTLV